MTPRTVPIICAKAPRHIVYVPAVRRREAVSASANEWIYEDIWECSYCGARVRVVA